MLDTTVLITTIGRPSLKEAVQSALREKFQVMVVSDGVPIDFCDLSTCKYLKLAKRNGAYGSMAINVGVHLAETDFVTLLNDDDELAEGSGDVIRQALINNPTVDIWIPGLRYNDGSVACVGSGLVQGNVAVPTYRTEIFKFVPFTHLLTPASQYIDFYHIQACVHQGYTVKWFGQVLYLVRPHLPGYHGVQE